MRSEKAPQATEVFEFCHLLIHARLKGAVQFPELVRLSLDRIVECFNAQQRDDTGQ